MITKSLRFLFPATLALSMFSCGEKPVEVKDEEITKDVQSDEVRNDLGLIRANIPSPIVVTKQLSKAGCTYNRGILNASTKTAGYSSNLQAAANLGVYGADLAYAASFNQSQDVQDYLIQVAKLAKTVGIESAFDEAFAKKMTENIGKPDSLLGMIDLAFEKAERNLRSNQRVSKVALIVAGGWVEGLYIACESVNSKPKDKKTEELYKGIYNHIYAFNYVIDLLKQFNKDADCAKMLEIINSAENIIAGYSKNPNLGQADAVVIRDAMVQLRNKII